MRVICSLAICGMLCTQLPAQSNAKTNAKPAAQTERASVSSQELNIRAYTELLRTDLRKSKSQIVGQVMQFDSDQAATFWPIYREFENDLTRIGDRTLGLIKKYADNYDQMTDEVADQLANELLTIEQQRNELKKQYYQKFKEALDPITATRFLQVENQLERIIDLQISSELPVIQASRGESQ